MTTFASRFGKPVSRQYATNFTARQHAQSRQPRPPPELRTLHCADVPEFQWLKQPQKTVPRPLSDWPWPLPQSHPGWLYQAPGKEKRSRLLRVRLLLSTVWSLRSLPQLQSPSHLSFRAQRHQKPPLVIASTNAPNTPAPHPAAANTLRQTARTTSAPRSAARRTDLSCQFQSEEETLPFT